MLRLGTTLTALNVKVPQLRAPKLKITKVSDFDEDFYCCLEKLQFQSNLASVEVCVRNTLEITAEEISLINR